jgi:hypothetical protein
MINETVFVFGGFKDKTAEEYWLNLNSWTNLSPIPFTSAEPFCFAVDLFKDNLYIAASRSTQMAKFQPISKIFSTLNFQLQMTDNSPKVIGTENTLLIFSDETFYEVDNEGNLLI